MGQTFAPFNFLL